MTRVVLANEDYLCHMSDEGRQLQDGLAHAGWRLVYASEESDVRRIVDRFRPTHVFVQDVRDWDPESPICKSRDDIGFRNVEVLQDPAIRVSTVMKDAWGWQDLQREWYERAGVETVVHYYARDVVVGCSPWLDGYDLRRIYHSVDVDLCRSLWRSGADRKRGTTTGAQGKFYPLRQKIRKRRAALGLDLMPHPGHHNHGAHTPAYLDYLAGYKVHVFTGGHLQVAFRKHMESVALGLTPITTLHPEDVLPEIDGAMVRIEQDEGSLDGLHPLITECERSWNERERREYAERCWAYYDYRAAGLRLDRELTHAEPCAS